MPTDPVNRHDFTGLICASLRGEAPRWPWADEPEISAPFIEESQVAGVGALLYRGVAALNWPSDVLQALRARIGASAMWESQHREAVAEALAALSAHAIPAVLIKGTALAYSLYADPALRTRGDTDLVIPPETEALATRALEQAGFSRALAVDGKFVSYQASFSRTDELGLEHILDVHWKLNNSEVLSRLLTHEELAREAVAIPALSEHARGASRVHSLLIACIHRCTHRQNPYYVNSEPHYTDNRLIWLYDIHLLANAFSTDEWARFSELAASKRVRSICRDGLLETQSHFATHVPANLLTGTDAATEPVFRYLAASKLRQQWMDFVALRNPLHQWQYIRESLFPSASYMRAKFPDESATPMAWLYLRRAASGLTRLCRSAVHAR